MPDLGTAIALTIVLAAVVVPGLAIALAIGLRGWLLAAAAPGLTFGLVGLTRSVVRRLA